jgi:hypothetical protein
VILARWLARRGLATSSTYLVSAVLALSTALIVASPTAGASTTGGPPSAYGYDVTTIPRVGVHVSEVAEVSPAQLASVRKASASPSGVALAASMTSRPQSVAPTSALDDIAGAIRPSRISGPGNVDLPGVPSGASGVPTSTGRGLAYDLPPGTAGIDPRVTQIRVMNPLTTGPHQYPNGYVAYMNEAGQTVNPLTGRTVLDNADPFAHIELPG